MSGARRIRVAIVDDSAMIRSLLAQIINAQPDMEVVGSSPDPVAAREMIRSRDPDVITLDVEMPHMDGLEFLEKLMRLRPTPVVMVSTLTERGAETTLRALELGAVDFVSKPRFDVARGLAAYAGEITDKIRAAAAARVRRRDPRAEVRSPAPELRLRGAGKVIVVGASTGGTEAIRELLAGLPPDAPGMLIAQHMPAGFTASFARRLNECGPLRVSEARHHQRVLPGHAFIAPGNRHLRLARSGAGYVTALSDDAPVNRHRPSVEVLFRSAAECAGSGAIGAMLTGMGNDGAAAMRQMRDAGAYNFAQDEASCVVFGMPREAIAAGAVHEVVPLRDLARRMIARLSSGA
jgi:two-component system chemotaxis response regulator CheB